MSRPFRFARAALRRLLLIATIVAGCGGDPSPPEVALATAALPECYSFLGIRWCDDGDICSEGTPWGEPGNWLCMPAECADPGYVNYGCGDDYTHECGACMCGSERCCHNGVEDPLFPSFELGVDCGGQCATECDLCPLGEIDCGGTCIDPATDPNNCGLCGVQCTGGTQCIFGLCVCAPDELFCDNTCIDPHTNDQHCGFCGVACPQGSSCQSGLCLCSGVDGAICDGGCVDRDSDDNHCGACGNQCPAGTSCQGGQCLCPDPGQTACGGVCTDTDTDEGNCGGCGVVCPVDTVCTAGACVCTGAGETNCSGQCVELDSDPSHCGACGNACAPGESCVGGACLDLCGNNVQDAGEAGVDCGGTCLSPCVEAACGDFADDDGDGLTDCADPDCLSTVECSQGLCTEGVLGERQVAVNIDSPWSADMRFGLTVPGCGSLEAGPFTTGEQGGTDFVVDTAFFTCLRGSSADITLDYDAGVFQWQYSRSELFGAAGPTNAISRVRFQLELSDIIDVGGQPRLALRFRWSVIGHPSGDFPAVCTDCPAFDPGAIDPDFCTALCPCDAGEGECSGDLECAAGLVCGTDNGAPFDLPAGSDVCWPAGCELDPGAPECAVDCSATCSSSCPCGPYEDRPCRGDGECDDPSTPLSCGSMNGRRFGDLNEGNRCWPASCDNGVWDEGEDIDAPDCGGPCGPCDECRYWDPFCTEDPGPPTEERFDFGSSVARGTLASFETTSGADPLVVQVSPGVLRKKPGPQAALALFEGARTNHLAEAHDPGLWSSTGIDRSASDAFQIVDLPLLDQTGGSAPVDGVRAIADSSGQQDSYIFDGVRLPGEAGRDFALSAWLRTPAGVAAGHSLVAALGEGSAGGPLTRPTDLTTMQNDSLAAATANSIGDVRNLWVGFSGSNSGLSSQNGTDFGCSAYENGRDAFFHFSLSTGTEVVIDTVGSSLDTVIALYRGDGSFIACNRDGAGSDDSVISANLTPGDYYVVLEPDSWFGSTGSYRFYVRDNAPGGGPPPTTELDVPVNGAWARHALADVVPADGSVEARLSVDRWGAVAQAAAGDALEVVFPQLEIGEFPSSWIYSTAGGATRDADLLAFADAAPELPGWLRDGVGTVDGWRFELAPTFDSAQVSAATRFTLFAFEDNTATVYNVVSLVTDGAGGARIEAQVPWGSLETSSFAFSAGDVLEVQVDPEGGSLQATVGGVDHLAPASPTWQWPFGAVHVGSAADGSESAFAWIGEPRAQVVPSPTACTPQDYPDGALCMGGGGSCQQGQCEILTTCDNGVQDGDETGRDCGGSCTPCSETVCTDGVDDDADGLVDCADTECVVGDPASCDGPCAEHPVGAVTLSDSLAFSGGVTAVDFELSDSTCGVLASASLPLDTEGHVDMRESAALACLRGSAGTITVSLPNLGRSWQYDRAAFFGAFGPTGELTALRLQVTFLQVLGDPGGSTLELDFSWTALGSPSGDYPPGCQSCPSYPPPADDPAFCTPLCPCDGGQGGCQDDLACFVPLVCGSGNGARFGLPAGFGACWPPHCENGVQDSGAGELGVDCGGPCGSCPVDCDAEDTCSTTCPCPDLDPRPCESDLECAAGSVCGSGNGRAFGDRQAGDRCWPASCEQPGACSDPASCGPCGECQYWDPGCGPGGTTTLESLDLGSSVTRATIATYTDYTAQGEPVVVAVAAGTLRVRQDASVGPMALFEGASTNLLGEAAEPGLWSMGGIDRSATDAFVVAGLPLQDAGGVLPSPVDAVRMHADGSAADSFMWRAESLPGAAGDAFSLSAWLRTPAGTSSPGHGLAAGLAPAADVWIDVPESGPWSRASLVASVPVSEAVEARVSVDRWGATAVAAAGEAVELVMPQLELGDFATSWIHTSGGGGAVRDADRLQLTGVQVPAWLTDGATVDGSWQMTVMPIFASAQADVRAAEFTLLDLGNGTLVLRADGDGDGAIALEASSATGTTAVTGLSFPAEARLEIRVWPALGQLEVSIDGGPASTSSPIGDLAWDGSTVQVGSDAAGLRSAYAWLSPPRALVDATVSCQVYDYPDGTPCGSGAESCQAGSCQASAACGDGVRQEISLPGAPREPCDDGNGDAGDACSPQCGSQALIVAPQEVAALPARAHAPGHALDGQGNLLFVWQDVRDGESRVLGRRLSALGVAIDAEDAPLVLSDDLGEAWDGEPTVAGLASGGFAVAWSAPAGDGDQGDILVRTVPPSGGGLGAIRVATEMEAFHQTSPRLAALAAGFVLVWIDHSPLTADDDGASLKGRIFDDAAAPTGPERLLAVMRAGDQRDPQVASAGDDWMVVWTDDNGSPFNASGRRLLGRRFAGALALDQDDLLISVGGHTGSVAALPRVGDFVVAFTQPLNFNDAATFASVVTPEGGVGAALPVGRTAVSQRFPSVAAIGPGAYLVSWSLGDGLRDVDFAILPLPPASWGAVPEEQLLHDLLGGRGKQLRPSVKRDARGGVWIGWHDDPVVGPGNALHAFLLPPT